MPASTGLFDFEQDCFDLADVVLAAVGWGEWQKLERALGEGLACEAEAARSADDLDPQELRAAVVEFRRSHRLLAGEDYLRWLAERFLTSDDVLAHARRRALRTRSVSTLDPSAVDEVPADRLDAAVQGEAILSGRLRSWCDRLARCAAARCALEADAGCNLIDGRDEPGRLLTASSQLRTSWLRPDDVAPRAQRIARLIASEAAFRASMSTPESIDRRLAEHRLDWQRLAWTEASFHAEGAAREAALMVREDGSDLESVATLARAQTGDRAAYLADVPELASLFAAAVPGELLGPFELDGSWRLALVSARTAVGAEDPVLCHRAVDEIVEYALSRHLAGRVSWHVPV
jgi:hypothetical protein